MLGDCLSSSVSVMLEWVPQLAGKWTYGTNPAGGSAEGRLEIVDRHAVLADSWGQ